MGNQLTRLKKQTIQQMVDLAMQHLQSGQLPEAKAIYQQILIADPSHSDALHYLGLISLQEERVIDAASLIERAITINPNDANALNNLGQVYERLERLDDSTVVYRKAIQCVPDHKAALNNLGNVLAAKGEYSEAVQCYQRALAVNKNDPEIHSNLGDVYQEQALWDDAIASYRVALGIDPGFFEVHISLGNALRKQGLLEDAVASYREAVRINPKHYGAHSNLGTALQEQGLLDDAVASYRKAIVLNAIYSEAHSNLGSALHEQGLLEDAVASYREALRINPKHYGAHTNLGNALKDQGLLEDAVASHHKALAIEPYYAEAWNNLKYVSKALVFSNSDYDRTAPSGEDGLNDAARATPYFAIQQFYLDGFRPHEADESFEKVIAALPAKTGEAIPIGGIDPDKGNVKPFAKKVVALLHFGRSGTGLLHSLIDNHPEISTLPGIYLSGYFNAGVWKKISANGWLELPSRFADQFAVLFNAKTPKPIPYLLGEDSFFTGKKEGMTCVGENRNESLSLDRGAFCAEALKLLEGMENVCPMSFLMIVHAAFETVMGAKTKKHLCFYHIHNPDDYAKPNFLRYAPDARLVMMVREPIQNCESWVRKKFEENDYGKVVSRLLKMLFDIDQVVFRMRESMGVRLEDLKTRPEATIQSLSAWLGVEDSPTLYEMTAQGKKWWGDPSSPDYNQNEAMSPFSEASTKRPVGAVFSEKDQFVLRTLFYPFCVRFEYQKPDPGQFKKDLKEVKPLLDDMFDFEKAMAERKKINHAPFKRNGDYQVFRAGLIDRWNVLNELGDYPSMLTPLEILKE